MSRDRVTTVAAAQEPTEDRSIQPTAGNIPAEEMISLTANDSERASERGDERIVQARSDIEAVPQSERTREVDEMEETETVTRAKTAERDTCASTAGVDTASAEELELEQCIVNGYYQK